MSEKESKSTEAISDVSTYLKSSFYEQLVEHTFISELLQEVHYKHRKTVEVLKSEVDAYGYDVVFECNGYLRHVQLKTSRYGSNLKPQKVNVILAKKSSGCVVWVLRDEESSDYRMNLKYLFFGGNAGEPLPSLENFRYAKHTKRNKDGIKTVRQSIRLIPKSQFTFINTTHELVRVLFGLSDPTGNPSNV